jgi:hypothetical protein
MNEVLRDLTTVLMAIIGVAILALLVSKKSNTTGVINSSSSAFNSALGTAESPVTGYDPGPPIYSQSGFLGTSFQIPELGAGFLGGAG